MRRYCCFKSLFKSSSNQYALIKNGLNDDVYTLIGIAQVNKDLYQLSPHYSFLLHFKNKEW